MKTDRKTTKRNDERKTAAWLTGRYRNGRHRVDVLGWKKLAAMWRAARPGGPVRRAIAAECRRCGYRPTTILSLNAEQESETMRITSIELAGSIETGKRVPRAFARIARTADGEYIEVTIIRPGGERKHMVQADCEEDLWSMAECLQETLDGCRGTNSMIHDYLRVLQHLVD